MLWVLIRMASRGDSNEYPQHMFLWRFLVCFCFTALQHIFANFGPGQLT